MESLPAEFETTNLTANVPFSEYVTTGFCSVEVSGVPPAKVHCLVSGKFLLMSVKCTEPPTSTIALSHIKLATGATTFTGSVTVMYPCIVFVLESQGVVTFKDTAKDAG